MNKINLEFAALWLPLATAFIASQVEVEWILQAAAVGVTMPLLLMVKKNLKIVVASLSVYIASFLHLSPIVQADKIAIVVTLLLLATALAIWSAYEQVSEE